jgi:hypothetical protein
MARLLEFSLGAAAKPKIKSQDFVRALKRSSPRMNAGLPPKESNFPLRRKLYVAYGVRGICRADFNGRITASRLTAVREQRAGKARAWRGLQSVSFVALSSSSVGGILGRYGLRMCNWALRFRNRVPPFLVSHFSSTFVFSLLLQIPSCTAYLIPPSNKGIIWQFGITTFRPQGVARAHKSYDGVFAFHPTVMRLRRVYPGDSLCSPCQFHCSTYLLRRTRRRKSNRWPLD